MDEICDNTKLSSWIRITHVVLLISTRIHLLYVQAKRETLMYNHTANKRYKYAHCTCLWRSGEIRKRWVWVLIPPQKWRWRSSCSTSGPGLETGKREQRGAHVCVRVCASARVKGYCGVSAASAGRNCTTETVPTVCGAKPSMPEARNRASSLHSKTHRQHVP